MCVSTDFNHFVTAMLVMAGLQACLRPWERAMERGVSGRRGESTKEEYRHPVVQDQIVFVEP